LDLKSLILILEQKAMQLKLN